MRGALKAGQIIKTSSSLAIVRAVAWSIRCNLASLPTPLVAASLCAGFLRSLCSVWKAIQHRKLKRLSPTMALT